MGTNFAYLGINNVFEHFVTKQTLGCGHDSAWTSC